jgi:hypothetical protein
MATCPLTSSYDNGANCIKFAGGVKVIAFVESYNKNTITIANGVVTAMALQAAQVFRTYRVIKNKSFVTDEPVTTENGALSYKPIISLFLNDLSTALRQEVHLLLKNQTIIAWLDQQNVWRLAGYYNFMNSVGGNSANFGTAIGDGQNQTIVFTGEEMAPMYEINTATATALGLPLL